VASMAAETAMAEGVEGTEVAEAEGGMDVMIRRETYPTSQWCASKTKVRRRSILVCTIFAISE